MPGFQSDYNPGQEAITVEARPDIQTVQAQNNPRGSNIWQLAAALGVSAPQISQATQQVNKQEVDEATEKFNSMKLSDVGDQIRAGTLAPDASPLFQATMQHLWGQNSAAQMEQQTIASIRSGQLKFDTPDQLSAYMTDQRNKLLGANASQFMQEGVNKNWQGVMGAVAGVNSEVTTARNMAAGEMTADQSLLSTYTMGTAANSNETPQSLAGKLAGTLELNSHTLIPTIDQQRQAATNIAYRVAEDGNPELVKSLMDQSVNGMPIRALIGDLHASRVEQRATMMEDQNAREALKPAMQKFILQAQNGQLNADEFGQWNEANLQHLSPEFYPSILRANQNTLDELAAEKKAGDVALMKQQLEGNNKQLIDSAVQQGTLSEQDLSRMKTVDSKGDPVPFQWEQYAKDSLAQYTQGMDFPHMVDAYAKNGVVNEDVQRTLQAGAANLASVTQGPNGKPGGQLNQVALDGIAKYAQLRDVNPDVADRWAEGTAKDLSDIYFMTHSMGFDANKAANVVMERKAAGIKPELYQGIDKPLRSAVDDVVNNNYGYLSKVGAWWSGNGVTPNVMNLQADITRAADLLMSAGIAANPKQAAETATNYYANPQVTAVVNGAVYKRADLPQAPKGFSQEDLLTGVINQMLGPVAKEQGTDMNRVWLKADGNGTFTAIANGIPMSDSRGLLKFSSSWLQQAFQKQAQDLRSQRVQTAKQQATTDGISPASDNTGGVPNFGGDSQ